MTPVERSPVVLLPGIRGGPSEHARLAAALPGRVVHALALPDLDHRGATLADFAAALLPHLPDEPAVVVGASFGGLIAWALPPARVAALVTIGTLPGPSRAQAQCRRRAALVRLLPGPLYRRLYGARTRAGDDADDPGGALLGAIELPSPAQLSARLGAIGRWGLPARPPGPAVWVWGADDPFAVWTVDAVHAIGATPRVVPGAHRPHVSHPDAVAACIPG